MFLGKRITQPLAEILSRPVADSAEERLIMDAILPGLILMQELPDLALMATTGIVVPPHQRTTLYTCHAGFETNVNVSSRGTAKTTNVAVFYLPYKGAFFKSRKAITLVLTGFRGAQTIFNDIQRWLNSGFDSQKTGYSSLRDAVVKGEQIIKRSQNMWSLEWSSFSTNIALPTTDHDRILGNRANDIVIDEFKLIDEFFLDKVIMPFLNVLGDFEHGGAFAEKNAVFYTTTIDYQWRYAEKRIQAAKDSIARDREWDRAARRGDFVRAKELEKLGILDSTYISYDYTDLLVRRKLVTRDGRRFKVNYPTDKLPLVLWEEGIPFVERGPDGRMMKHGPPVEAWRTYPINKKQLEQGLIEGTTDEAVWLSEQRNIIDTSTGEVYAHVLVSEASCEGEREVIPWAECDSDWQRAHEEGEGWTPPVMWACDDPCGLGIDYAPGGGDFVAFCVIRYGPCATGEFKASTGTGKSAFSNVIWVEQHRRMSGHDVAERVWEFAQRYRLAYFHDPYVEDTWELCRAVGLDVRGGGNTVRDNLVRIDEDTLRPGTYRMYDPLDKDDKVLGFAATSTADQCRAMLDCIRPTPKINDTLVEWTLGQMQQKRLYLPRYLDRSERTDRKLDIAYEASRSLTNQMRKLKQEPTAQGRKFFIDGDTNLVENKKDLVSAFWYAAKQHRSHVIRQRTIDETPPPIGGLVTRVNRHRGRSDARVAGSKGF
jgi:predicted component of type VI protein secretion system